MITRKQADWPRPFHRSVAQSIILCACDPFRRRQTAGANPCFRAEPRRAAPDTAAREPPYSAASGYDQPLLRALLRDARQQRADLRLAVPAVSAQRPDRCQLPSLRPPSHRLRVNPKHRGDLCRCQQLLDFWGTCRHFDGLSSWTGIAILRPFVCTTPFGIRRRHLI